MKYTKWGLTKPKVFTNRQCRTHCGVRILWSNISAKSKPNSKILSLYSTCRRRSWTRTATTATWRTSAVPAEYCYYILCLLHLHSYIYYQRDVSEEKHGCPVIRFRCVPQRGGSGGIDLTAHGTSNLVLCLSGLTWVSPFQFLFLFNHHLKFEGSRWSPSRSTRQPGYCKSKRALQTCCLMSGWRS